MKLSYRFWRVDHLGTSMIVPGEDVNQVLTYLNLICDADLTEVTSMTFVGEMPVSSEFAKLYDLYKLLFTD